LTAGETEKEKATTKVGPMEERDIGPRNEG